MTLQVDITHRFEGFTLNARFEAGAGTTVLFGRSGSGKSTILRAIAGLLMPQSGHITLAARHLFGAALPKPVPPHARRIGTVFQDARLFPHLSVQGNLDYGTRFAPNPLNPKARADLIDVLGIGHLLTRRIGALSGGEAQRVAFGRALMTAPDLLLLDEPLAALDASRKEEILPYLERLRVQGGPPMIYVTHDMSEIVRLADRLVVLRDGTCVAQGSAEDVLSDPANVPLIGATEAGALLTGTLVEQAQDGLSILRLSAADLVLPRIDAPLGSQVRLRLRAQDVILSLGPPTGLSTQNALPARITDLHRGDGPGVAVGLVSGTDRLLARITARAAAQLDLKTGQEVWAILKASSVPRAAIQTQATKSPSV
jgi:molybdate transport system ATP-binding protein